MFWSEGRKQGGLALAFGLAALVTLALAATAHATVYFGDQADHAISKASTTGGTGLITDSDFVSTAPNRSLMGLAVDGRHIYWSNTDTDNAGANDSSIGRATLDDAGHVIPASVNQSFITGLSQPFGLAVDARPDTTYLYWADPRTPYTFGDHPPPGLDEIGRVEISPDGTLVAGTLHKDFIAGASAPFDVDVDAHNVYWSNSGNNTIGHASLDDAADIVGTPDQNMITGVDPAPDDPATQTDALDPEGIAISNGFLYWANHTYKGANIAYNPAQPIGDNNQPVTYGDGQTISRVPVGPDGLPSAAVNRTFVGPGAAGNHTDNPENPTGLATDGASLYWDNYGIPFFGNQDDDIGRTSISNPVGGFKYSFIPTGFSVSLAAQRDSTLSVDCPTSEATTSTCTVTVNDASDAASATAPTGTVSFSGTGGGTWSLPGNECILASTSTTSSTCTIVYTRASDEGERIDASYAGDVIHASDSGSGTLLPQVIPPPIDPPFIPPLGDGGHGGGGGGGGSSSAVPGSVDLKKCKKKKGKAKKKCIKKAKAKASQ